MQKTQVFYIKATDFDGRGSTEEGPYLTRPNIKENGYRSIFSKEAYIDSDGKVWECVGKGRDYSEEMRESAIRKLSEDERAALGI